jgi:aldehyde dehydrogenase (NAD+)
MTPQDLLGGIEATGLFVAGKAVPAAGETVAVEDPATREVIAEVAEASDADVAEAVRSAGASFESWRETPGAERGRILVDIARAIRADAEHLARLESLDTGKPVSQARGDVETSARYFEFYAGVADKLYGETLPGDGAYWAYTLREPYGVIAHITPWNSPMSQMCRGVAPSLAAGNTVVVKPSEVTPLSTFVAADLFVRAGLPSGVCNVVAGRGLTTGAALVRATGVEHVTFTGSVATGRRILQMAAERIVGCNLELGGKSPTIVLPDADLDAAVTAGAMAIVRNAGQSCFATTRILVQRSIAAAYADRLAEAVSRLTVGPGLDDLDLGPLASAGQLTKVSEAISTATAEGAELLVGGTPVDGLRGYFLAPAVLAGVSNDMRVAREEVFGPVQTVIAFDDLDEAVSIANDSDYGLAAGIFTRDITTAHALARRLQAGQVQINKYPLGGVDTPFGGYKQSGMGREKGLAALDHYTQVKTVIVSE